MTHAPLTDKQLAELDDELKEYKEAAAQGCTTYLDWLCYEADLALFYLEHERRKHFISSATLARLEREYDEARKSYLEAKAEAF